MSYIKTIEQYIQNIAINMQIHIKDKFSKGRAMPRLNSQEILKLINQDEDEDIDEITTESSPKKKLNLKAKKQFKRFNQEN